MTKLFFLVFLITAPAQAAPSLPHGEPAQGDPVFSLQKLERDLEAERIAQKTSSKPKGAFGEFREELQLGLNDQDAEREKLPLAPEDEEATPRK